MNKSKWIYDLEVFPNLNSNTFINADDPDITKVFTICLDLKIDEHSKLKEFLDNEVDMLVGYNNLFYDYPVLEFIYNYSGANINNDIYELSKKIIYSDRGENFGGYRRSFLWEQHDLMKMMAFDKLGVSLKQCAINLKWKKIQDLPLPYDYTVISMEEVELIIKYNINDVLISYELYKSLAEEIKLREELGKLYGVQLLSASDSKIANILLEKIYTEESGVELSTLRNLRTPRDYLWLKECISPKIKFKTKKLRDLKFEIANTLVVSENNFAYKKKLEFGNCKYELGIGGLHSDDNACIFKSDDGYKILDRD